MLRASTTLRGKGPRRGHASGAQTYGISFLRGTFAAHTRLYMPRAMRQNFHQTFTVFPRSSVGAAAVTGRHTCLGAAPLRTAAKRSAHKRNSTHYLKAWPYYTGYHKRIKRVLRNIIATKESSKQTRSSAKNALQNRAMRANGVEQLLQVEQKYDSGFSHSVSGVSDLLCTVLREKPCSA